MANKVMRASTELSAIVPEIWSANYYDVFLAELPFRALIDDRYEGEIANLGDTVRINTFPEFDDAEIVSEGQAVDADAITVQQQPLVVNKRIVKDFIVTNKATLQSLPAMDKLQELAIYAINKKTQREIITDSVPSVAKQLSYASGTTLDLVDILNAKEALDLEDAPQSDRHMVVGAPQLNDIFNIVGFTSSDFITSGAPLVSGQLPSALLGFNPNFTTEVGETSYFFHRSYQTIAAQKGIDVKEYDLGVEGKRASRVNIDTLLGNRVLDNERIVTIS